MRIFNVNKKNKASITPLADHYFKYGYVFVETKDIDPGTKIRIPSLTKEEIETNNALYPLENVYENKLAAANFKGPVFFDQNGKGGVPFGEKFPDFWWFVVFFILCSLFILIIRGPIADTVDQNKKELYYNRDGIIIGMDEERIKESDGRYHNIKKVLIQDAIDNEMQIEFVCEPDQRRYRLVTCLKTLKENEWFAKHKIGDKVFFKYIRKDRYFKIHKEKPSKTE